MCSALPRSVQLHRHFEQADFAFAVEIHLHRTITLDSLNMFLHEHRIVRWNNIEIHSKEGNQILTLTTCMTSLWRASISTPSRSSDPRCEAKMTLRRSLATDLVDDAVLGAAVAPTKIFPIFPRNDMFWNLDFALSRPQLRGRSSLVSGLGL